MMISQMLNVKYETHDGKEVIAHYWTITFLPLTMLIPLRGLLMR